MTSGRPSRSFVACAGRTVDFCKYQGLGNDFILVRTIKAQGQVMPTALATSFTSLVSQVDNRHQRDPVLSPEQASRLCNRNFGVGGDGVRASAHLCLLLRVVG